MPVYQGSLATEEHRQCQALPPALTSLRSQHLTKCPLTRPGPCYSLTPRVCGVEVPGGNHGAVAAPLGADP